MNRLINILLFSSITLFASVEQVQQYYEAGQYEKAIKEAKSSKSEYSNPNLHLLWAKSAEALGRVDEAMSAYERVVMLDEENVDVKLRLANIYSKTQRYTLASESKKELQNYQLTPEQRNSLGLLRGEDVEELKAKASLNMGYDSNINVGASGDEISTLFGRFSGSVSYINELKAKKAWYTRADLKLYYQNNMDAHYYDMLVAGLDMGLGYAGDNYTFYIPIGYDTIHYLDVNMLSQLRLEPKVNITLDDMIVNVNAKYSSRSYKQTIHKGMDDTSFGFGSGLYYLIGKDFAYINFKYENFSSDKTLHNQYIDKNMITSSIGLNYNVNDFLVSRFDYRFRLGSYDDVVLDTNDKRKDNYNQFEVKLSHFLDEKQELYISNRYVKNSSNYADADYTKNIVMFGISVNY